MKFSRVTSSHSLREVSFYLEQRTSYGGFISIARSLCVSAVVFNSDGIIWSSHVSKRKFGLISIPKQLPLWNSFFFLSGFLAFFLPLLSRVHPNALKNQIDLVINMLSCSISCSLKELSWVMVKAPATGMFSLMSLVSKLLTALMLFSFPNFLPLSPSFSSDALSCFSQVRSWMEVMEILLLISTIYIW
jgi:hypothetical protein